MKNVHVVVEKNIKMLYWKGEFQKIRSGGQDSSLIKI